MKVLLERNLSAKGFRYRKNSDGVEIPDDVELPSDAKIWQDGKWVPAYAEGESPRERSAIKTARTVRVQQAASQAVAAAAIGVVDAAFKEEDKQFPSGKTAIQQRDLVDQAHAGQMARDKSAADKAAAAKK